MTGNAWRVTRRGMATLISVALFTVGAAGPALAAGGSDGSAIQIDIWNGRSAYGTAATVRFFLSTDSAGYPLVTDEGYARAAGLGLARIDLLADGRLVGTATAQPWSITWDPGALPEAPVLLTARSYDQAGRTSDTHFGTSVDHTAPTLRVHQNGYIRAGGDVYAEAGDTFGVTGVDLLAGDRIVDSARAATTLLHWDRDAVDGPATLAVRARDTAGNVAEFRRSVLVDNVAPAFAVAPAAGAYVRGTVPFTVSAVRDASGLEPFEVRFNGTWFAAASGAPRVARVDTRGMADGTKVVQCWGTDRAGNATRVERTVILDNHAPTIAYVKAPKDKARVTKSFAVTAKATDRYGIARVQLLVNGKVVATDGKAGYGFTINPKRYGKKFTVQLRSYDRAGNGKYTSKRTYRR
jgi:hypothetical protein